MTLSPAFGKPEETAEMERSSLEARLPNHFVLKGGVTKIAYDVDPVTGKPKFVYEGAFGSKTFVGAGIRDTEICHMITVKVRDTNQEVTTLTVLIPTLSLKKDGPTSFTAMAIFTTTHRRTGFEGALQAYDVEKLTGEALPVESGLVNTLGAKAGSAYNATSAPPLPHVLSRRLTPAKA